MTLQQYILEHPSRTDDDWAAFFGMSRSFFWDVKTYRRMPSDARKIEIERLTDGRVTFASWAEVYKESERRKALGAGGAHVAA